MRLTPQQATSIQHLCAEIFGQEVSVKVFGSRLDDQLKGGDLDLLVKSLKPIPEPARKSALLSTRVSRLLQGRKVDVLLIAPNLKYLPIHRIAEEQGELL
ncbi:nucleotidyltransferase domain-containing protein [Marinospirillum perlucidum]|uniref:nucleotidyltransferase domain-containing protein n=1 Tax=Marinospirillum perlucidum TaxID=1982602 RepID=UPI001C49A44F|nr:nucleotidyltransferase domain-containing protein [Marinospirillum perlucidum]